MQMMERRNGWRNDTITTKRMMEETRDMESTEATTTRKGTERTAGDGVERVAGYKDEESNAQTPEATAMRRGRDGTGTSGRRCDEAKGSRGSVAVIYAWWKAYGDRHERTGATRAHAHIYATRFKPSAPLDLGMRVKLVALAKDQTTTIATELGEYKPYDPHVVGDVVDIVWSSPGWVRATVANACRGNEVGWVEVELPYEPDITVRGGRLNGSVYTMEETYQAPRANVPLRAEGANCGAENCHLEPPKGRRERTIRTRPMKGGDEANGDLRASGEGTFALHLWMKYEYAR